jgi:uncharacterized membrane protein
MAVSLLELVFESQLLIELVVDFDPGAGRVSHVVGLFRDGFVELNDPLALTGFGQ